MLLPPGRNGRMSIINIMNSFVYHKYMSRGEMLSIYIPDALTIAVYFTRLLTCLYLARAALIEFFSFLLKVLTGVTELRGRGRCESWAAEKSCKLQTMQKEVKCQLSVLTARNKQTIRGTPYSCLSLWNQSFGNIDADEVNCVTANLFHIFAFCHNQQPFHTKPVNVLLKLTDCFIQSCQYQD